MNERGEVKKISERAELPRPWAAAALELALRSLVPDRDVVDHWRRDSVVIEVDVGNRDSRRCHMRIFQMTAVPFEIGVPANVQARLRPVRMRDRR